MRPPDILGDGNPQVLSDADFWRWQRAVPPLDWDAFVNLHHGKEPHARFVCALDLLVNVQKRERALGTIVEAFAMATGTDPLSPATARDAKTSYDLDPVRFLWDRIERAKAREAKHRIEQMVAAAIERRLQAHLTAPDAKDPILKDALAFCKMIREEEKAEREALLDRGVDRLRGDAEAQRKAFAAPSDEQLSGYLKTIVEKIGPNRFAEVLEQALPREPRALS